MPHRSTQRGPGQRPPRRPLRPLRPHRRSRSPSPSRLRLTSRQPPKDFESRQLSSVDNPSASPGPAPARAPAAAATHAAAAADGWVCEPVRTISVKTVPIRIHRPDCWLVGGPTGGTVTTDEARTIAAVDPAAGLCDACDTKPLTTPKA
ncbi:DUF6233 domain-containing protein [Streptomyces sp. NPDC058289]|uniref:DUF6233 domain-containing protein n=1 Tax=Streptomyces sp. NPDC058289 TaxID=3346425 RepID=UPI0036EFA9AF